MSLGSSSSNLQKVETILGKPVLTFIIGAGLQYLIFPDASLLLKNFCQYKQKGKMTNHKVWSFTIPSHNYFLLKDN